MKYNTLMASVPVTVTHSNRPLFGGVFLFIFLWFTACADSTQPTAEGDMHLDILEDSGSVSGLLFPDDFVFGAASASHQIEGNNTLNNWYQFETLPQYAGQTADPSGLAANAYELWETDNRLVEETHLGSYRFSIEWSRIMPQRGVFDEAEIAHYRAIAEDLRQRDIAPFITLHHFTDPIWLNDLSDPDCINGPSDENLCGWDNPDAIDSYVQFVERIALEFADLVDDWTTFNEPNTVINVGYLLGIHAPGSPSSQTIIPDDERWLTVAAPVARALVEAHARAYDTIKATDLVDADGDGISANVGWTISSQYMQPADPEDETHLAGATRYREFLNYLFPDSIYNGTWDPNFDGVPDETHPEWLNKQDFIGVQYYSRVFVLGNILGMDILSFGPCFGMLADLLSACPETETVNVSVFNEIYPEGLYHVVTEFADRYPGIPLPLTENGVAANNGERKAQVLTRHLINVHRLVSEGYPVYEYYAWSLTDNFEWAEGFEPRFGLYEVDYETFERTATRAQEVYSDLAQTHVLSSEWTTLWGDGPLLPDE